MNTRQILPNLYVIRVGLVNTFLVTSPGGDTLIDTGFAGNAGRILSAVRELGSRPEDIRHILVTHAHRDHIGSLARIKAATGAVAYIHPLDASIVFRGWGFRPMRPAPGLRTKIMFRVFIRTDAQVEGTEVEHRVSDGDVLPIAGGMKAIHVPGHCAGQLAFFWPQHGGVLFAADACSNLMGLGWSVAYEDLEEGRRSLQKLAKLDFQTACFGHGKAILRGADVLFRRRWGDPNKRPGNLEGQRSSTTDAGGLVGAATR